MLIALEIAGRLDFVNPILSGHQIIEAVAAVGIGSADERFSLVFIGPKLKRILVGPLSIDRTGKAQGHANAR